MLKTNQSIWLSALLILILLSGCASPQSAGTNAAGAATAPAATQAAALPATAAPTAAVPVTGSGPATAAVTATADVPATGAPSGTPSAPASAATPATAAVTATAVIPTSGAAPAANCTSPAEVTPSMTEGPYFKQGSPEQSNLFQPGMAGTKLTLTGYVLDTSCQPIAGALLDFWQADAQGQYDNSGYTLRGHVFTDESGRYQIVTVIPGLYPGRTEHIHVKVQPPNGQVLTSQLFFPDVSQNQADQIFDQRLLVDLQDAPDGKTATYTFIVQR